MYASGDGLAFPAASRQGACAWALTPRCPSALPDPIPFRTATDRSSVLSGGLEVLLLRAIVQYNDDGSEREAKVFLVKLGRRYPASNVVVGRGNDQACCAKQTSHRRSELGQVVGVGRALTFEARKKTLFAPKIASIAELVGNVYHRSVVKAASDRSSRTATAAAPRVVSSC